MRKLILFAALLLIAGCKTTAPVSMTEPRRVVGTENDVRIDAEIFGERLSSSTNIIVKYDITNNRNATIAVADMVPVTSYDPETQTVTVNIGSEVPGATLLPRLIAVAPGEKKKFSTLARVNILVNNEVTPNSRFPNAMRVKVNFLNDTQNFEPLLAMTEKGVHDPRLAEDLFPRWLEHNESVYTNAIPMRWEAQSSDDTTAAPITGRRRRRPGT